MSDSAGKLKPKEFSGTPQDWIKKASQEVSPLVHGLAVLETISQGSASPNELMLLLDDESLPKDVRDLKAKVEAVGQLQRDVSVAATKIANGSAEATLRIAESATKVLKVTGVDSKVTDAMDTALQFTSGSADYGALAQSAVGVVGSAFGVSSEDSKKAQAALSAGLAIASGNYLAALPAAASLLGAGGAMGGGGGPDPVIMGQLGKMEGMLNEVLRNQEQMKKQLEDIEKQLHNLAPTMQTH